MMDEKTECGRPAIGYLIWPGREPIPMCDYHKEGPLRLAAMMGWPVQFVVNEAAGKCQSLDPHPEDE